MMRVARLIGAVVLAALPFWTHASVNPPVIVPQAPKINAHAYVLMDYHSSRVLSEMNADDIVEPASLTKMMTMYVVDHELRSGRLSMDELVTVSEKAWKSTGSRMFLEVNSQVPVQEIIKGIVVQSGNDASIAIAEHIAGSEDAFVAVMNQHAKLLGMSKTHFLNVTGMPQEGHVTTAHDMALLAQALIEQFPETYSLYSEKWFTYNGIKQPNRNRLLWQNEHVDGIKTGNTDNAGFCFVASANKDGMRLISVVMGAEDDGARMEFTNKLLTYGFRFFETHRLFEAGASLKEARVWMGSNSQLGLGTTKDIYVTIPQGTYDALQATLKLDKRITAPVQQGEALGHLEITLGDDTVTTASLTALSAVDTGGLFSRFSDYVSLTFQGADESP